MRTYVDIACPSVSTCYALGSNSVSITTDGGSLWTSEQLPNADTSEEVDYGSIKCPSTTMCVAAGTDEQGNSLVATTTDGGTTWSAQDAGGGGDISCPSTSECFDAGTTNPLEPPNFSALIARSTDGAATWQPVFEQPDPPVAPIDASAGDLSCPTTTNCLALDSAGDSDPGSPPSTSTLYATADGGTTWQAMDQPVSPGAVAGSLDCPRVEDCYLIDDSAATTQGTILASTNSGWTWDTEALPADVGWLDDLTCPTYFRCYATAINYPGGPKILATTNSGQSWTLQPI